MNTLPGVLQLIVAGLGIVLAGCSTGVAPGTATPSATAGASVTPSPAPSSTSLVRDIWGFEPLGPIVLGTYFMDPDLDPSTPLLVVY